MSKISDRYLEEIKKGFASEEEFQAFINSCQLPLKKSIKINIHRILPEQFIGIVEKYGWKLSSSGFIKQTKQQKNIYTENNLTISNQQIASNSFQNQNNLSSQNSLPEDIFYVDRDDTDIPLGKTFLHQSGFFYIQEIAAGLAARQIGPLKGDEIILDISAAPGGKSVQLGDYLLYFANKNNLTPGIIISNDVNKSRLKALSHNLNRMGIYNSGITAFNGFAFGKNLPEFFDHILVDAPCSGEGTGFKSDFALKFWHPSEIKKISNTQFQLLISAIKALKPGGTLVYSTCTLNPYENEENVAKILEIYKDTLTLENLDLVNISQGFSTFGNKQLLPQEIASKLGRLRPHIQKTGGFFIAKFKKINSLNIQTIDNKLAPKNPFKLDFSNSLQKKISKRLKENFGINIPHNKFIFIASKEKVYISSSKISKIKEHINFEKIGIPILKIDRQGTLRPTHHFGIIFEKYIKKNWIKIDFQTAQKYALGEDLTIDQVLDSKISNPPSNYIAIFFEQRGIGVGKLVNGYIKNKYVK